MFKFRMLEDKIEGSCLLLEAMGFPESQGGPSAIRYSTGGLPGKVPEK
jgi:hypothetical protein